MNLPDFSKHQPMAVAMDLDETTLKSNARLADRTRAALHAVHDIGVPMIIATSRPERVLPTLVGDDILAITSLVQMNGTIAVGRAGLSGSLKQTMDLGDAEICWNLATEIAPWARMTVEIDGTTFAVNHDDDINELWAFNMATPTMLVSFDEALRMDPVKISVNGLDGSLEALASELDKRLSDNTVAIRAGRIQFLNVVPKKASKSGAVASLLDSAGISLPDVLSFGDDYVDIDLIRDCGWSVAVENAIPEIKSLAKYSTASNDEHGVAIVLEQLVAALSK
jgi:hydroxymethylpyrimidine pyrophosphatase-like HAD family hydrolase